MKLQALMIAVALVAGTAFAQAPNSPAAAPANGSMATTDKASSSTDMQMEKAHKKMHKKVAKAKKHHASRHAMAQHHHHHMASARHHHHQTMASAGHHRHHMMGDTHAMGAGPRVDLNDSSRQQRMDGAYNDWLRTQGRR